MGGRGGGGRRRLVIIETVSSWHQWPAIWVVFSGGSASSVPPTPGPCCGPRWPLFRPVGLGTGS